MDRGCTASTPPPDKAGEREFGPAAAIDYDEVVLDWMDRHVRAEARDDPSSPPVRYFVMGDNRWQTSPTWPPPARPVVYYLSAAPAGTSRRGRSRPSRPTGPATSVFVADPDHPVINPYDSAGAHDYRALEQRPDVLTFDSPPLDHDTEVTGPIRARIYLSCDCRDTDVWVRLLDVAPDGTAYNLMSPGLDVVRASYRNPARDGSSWRPARSTRFDSTNSSPATSSGAGTTCACRSPRASSPISPVTCTLGISKPCRRGGSARRYASITTARIGPR